MKITTTYYDPLEVVVILTGQGLLRPTTTSTRFKLIPFFL